MTSPDSTGRPEDSLRLAKDPRLLRLSNDDNVLIVGRRIEAGETYTVGDIDLVADVELIVGSKVASIDLEPDDVVLRIGVPIGRITQPTPKGFLVHSHNLESQRQRATVRLEVAPI